MGLTGFNRARRLAAEKLGTSFDEVSHDLANEVLREAEQLSALEARTAELKALNWQELKDMLESLELDTAKPKGTSWDEFAIPQILSHEGLS